MDDAAPMNEGPVAVRDARGRFIKGVFPGYGFKPGQLHPRVIERQERDKLGKGRNRSRRRFSEDLRESAFEALDFLGRAMRGKIKATQVQVSIAHRIIEFAYGKEALMDAYGRREAGKVSAGKPIVVVSNIPRKNDGA